MKLVSGRALQRVHALLRRGLVRQQQRPLTRSSCSQKSPERSGAGPSDGRWGSCRGGVGEEAGGRRAGSQSVLTHARKIASRQRASQPSSHHASALPQRKSSAQVQLWRRRQAAPGSVDCRRREGGQAAQHGGRCTLPSRGGRVPGERRLCRGASLHCSQLQVDGHSPADAARRKGRAAGRSLEGRRGRGSRQGGRRRGRHGAAQQALQQRVGGAWQGGIGWLLLG